MDDIKVAVVGTGDGGIQNGLATTLGPAPNLLVTVVGPVAAIVVRFVNVFFTVLSGLVSAGMVTNVLPVDDFQALVVVSSKLAVSAATFGMFKDIVTIFGRLETKYPLLTGSI